ncbi:hypothetical protein DFQ29_008025 [Apophysomyces sp. BC1021]|nr:hypothetical protein DFQ29_008025 [Apophysomyces sp. BC1021]
MQQPAVHGKVVAGYFCNWTIYERNYNVVDLAGSAHNLTHILYAFANCEADGSVVLQYTDILFFPKQDVFADKDEHFPLEKTVNQKADGWNEQGNNLYGNFKQLFLLKQRYRHRKVSLSIGGWSRSDNFAEVASDPAKRARFVGTAVKQLADLGLDGIDIDWEFPKNDQEAIDYVHLVSQMRIALDIYQQRVGQTDQPRLLLTAAVPCGPNDYQNLRLREMEPYIDLFYLMAYDFAGSWDSLVGHQSPLYGGELCVHQAVEHYMQSIPPPKLVLGIPAYGRAFSNTDGPGTPFNGVPKGSWEGGEGVFDYKVLPKPGAVEHHDLQRKAAWSYDSSLREMVSYDSPVVVQAKCDYIKQKQLGGAMFWELSGDAPTDNPRSLLQTVHQALEDQHDTTSNHLEYPESQFDNIRAGMPQ